MDQKGWFAVSLVRRQALQYNNAVLQCKYVFAEAMNIAQQVLALDTRYNACRTLPRQNRTYICQVLDRF